MHRGEKQKGKCHLVIKTCLISRKGNSMHACCKLLLLLQDPQQCLSGIPH